MLASWRKSAAMASGLEIGRPRADAPFAAPRHFR
jgi:hypothetical protein